MTDDAKETLLVLETGLFPDAATLDEALNNDPRRSAIRRQKITPDKMDDADWDQLLSNILDAKNVLTL